MKGPLNGPGLTDIDVVKALTTQEAPISRKCVWVPTDVETMRIQGHQSHHVLYSLIFGIFQVMIDQIWFESPLPLPLMPMDSHMEDLDKSNHHT